MRTATILVCLAMIAPISVADDGGTGEHPVKPQGIDCKIEGCNELIELIFQHAPSGACAVESAGPVMSLSEFVSNNIGVQEGGVVLHRISGIAEDSGPEIMVETMTVYASATPCAADILRLTYAIQDMIPLP